MGLSQSRNISQAHAEQPARRSVSSTAASLGRRFLSRSNASGSTGLQPTSSAAHAPPIETTGATVAEPPGALPQPQPAQVAEAVAAEPLPVVDAIPLPSDVPPNTESHLHHVQQPDEAITEAGSPSLSAHQDEGEAPDTPDAPAETSDSERQRTLSLSVPRILVQGTVSSSFRTMPRLEQTNTGIATASEGAPSPSALESVSEAPLGRGGAGDTSASDDPSAAPRSTVNPEGADELSSSSSLLNSPAAQAVLIARLLTVAAASTAASLMPGQISIDGQTVLPFAGLSGRNVYGDPADSAASTATAPPEAPEADPAPSRRRNSWMPFVRPADPASAPAPSSTPRRFGWLNRRAPSPPRVESPAETDGLAAIVQRPSLADAPLPRADSPEGSFERFLSDLLTEIGVAILRESYTTDVPMDATGRSLLSALPSFMTDSSAQQDGLANGDESATLDEWQNDSDGASQPSSPDEHDAETANQAPQATDAAAESVSPSTPNHQGLAFIRSYRFPTQYLDRSGNLVDSPTESEEEHTTTEQPDEPPVPEGSADSASHDPTVASSPTSMNDNSNDSAPSSVQASPQPRPIFIPVAPVLFVGVQSVAAANQPNAFNPFGMLAQLLETVGGMGESPLRDGPAMTPNQPTSDEATADTHEVRQEDVEMTDATSSQRADDAPPLDGPPISAPTPDAAHSDETASSNPSRANAGSQERQWLMFMSAGFYPTDSASPIAPFLFSNLDNATYEDFIRLSELLGNVKSSTVSKEQLEKSGLRVVDYAGLKNAQAAGEVLENTVDRCLICLESYEEDDQVRLLSCKHAFHQQCVDRWLEKAKNSCPCCRTAAVASDPSPSPTATA